MTHRIVARVGLGYLSGFALLLGVWAGLAPRSFYDDFPGLGMAWVSVDGPYNEHLLRDIGSLNLALAVVLIAAFVTLTKQMVIVAAGASLAWNIPHFLYHAFNTDGLGTTDIVLNLGGLAFSSLYPMVLLSLAPKLEPATEPSELDRPRSTRTRRDAS